jgi:hypothetical protein
MTLPNSNPENRDNDGPEEVPGEFLLMLESHGPYNPQPASPELVEFFRRRRQKEAELQKLCEEHREELQRLQHLDGGDMEFLVESSD